MDANDLQVCLLPYSNIAGMNTEMPTYDLVFILVAPCLGDDRQCFSKMQRAYLKKETAMLWKVHEFKREI